MKLTVTHEYKIGRADKYPSDFYTAPQALFKDNEQLCLLVCGRRDEAVIYDGRDGYLYIYSANDELEYMSLTVVDLNDFEVIDNVFLDTSDFREVQQLSVLDRTKHMIQHNCVLLLRRSEIL